MLLEVDLYRLATHGRLPSLETAMTTMYMLLIQIIKLLRTKALELPYVEFVQTKLFDGEAFTKCTETDVVLSGLVQGTPYFTRVIAYNTLAMALLQL